MNKSVLFLEGDFNTEIIKKIRFDNKNLKIYALDYNSHKKLENLKIEYQLADDELVSTEKKEIDNLAIKFVSTWYDFNRANLTFEKISLPNLIDIELAPYFSSLLLKIFSIEKILKNNNFSHVYSITTLNSYIEKLSEFLKLESHTYLLEQNLGLLLDKINIKFNFFKFPFSINISRKNYIKIKSFYENLFYKLLSLQSKKNSSDDSILILNFHTTNYEDFLLELSKIKKNVILISQRRPMIWNLKSFNIIRKSKLKIFDLSIYEKSLKSEIELSSNEIKKNLDVVFSDTITLEKIFRYNGISFWDCIQNSFKNICYDRFSESVKRIILFKKFFENNNIKIILEWAETGQEEKECLYLSKFFNIPSIMLQHARMPTAKMWKPYGKVLSYFSSPLLSNFQAVWGKFTYDYAVSCGHSPKNIIITGSPRHDKFFNYTKNQQKKNIILFATTGWAGVAAETSTISSMIKFEKFVKKVFDTMKKFPDKQLVVKPHPHSENFVNALELFRKLDPSVPVLTNAQLPELIESAELVITFTNSTIAVESIIMNKPTISLQIEEWAKHEEISTMEAVLSVDEIDQIEPSIRKILNDVEFSRDIKNNGKKFLDIYMSNQGTSSKNLAEFLENF